MVIASGRLRTGGKPTTLRDVERLRRSGFLPAAGRMEGHPNVTKHFISTGSLDAARRYGPSTDAERAAHAWMNSWQENGIHNSPLIVEFQTLSEMCDYAEKPGKHQASMHDRNGLTKAESLKLARTGWKMGRENVEAIANVLRVKIEKSSIGAYARPKVARSVTGSRVNVPAYIAGSPTSMFTRKPMEKFAPLVHIGFGNTVGGNERAYLLRGAAIAALTDILENAGRRVQITWYRTMPTAELRCVVKRPESPLNLDAVGFSIAHMNMGCHVGWGAAESLPEPWQYASGNLANGGAGSMHHEPYNMDEVDIYIEALNAGGASWRDEDSTGEWILQQLAEQGIVMKDEV